MRFDKQCKITKDHQSLLLTKMDVSGLREMKIYKNVRMTSTWEVMNLCEL